MPLVQARPWIGPSHLSRELERRSLEQQEEIRLLSQEARDRATQYKVERIHLNQARILTSKLETLNARSDALNDRLRDVVSELQEPAYPDYPYHHTHHHSSGYYEALSPRYKYSPVPLEYVPSPSYRHKYLVDPPLYPLYPTRPHYYEYVKSPCPLSPIEHARKKHLLQAEQDLISEIERVRAKASNLRADLDGIERVHYYDHPKYLAKSKPLWY